MWGTPRPRAVLAERATWRLGRAAGIKPTTTRTSKAQESEELEGRADEERQTEEARDRRSDPAT